VGVPKEAFGSLVLLGVGIGSLTGAELDLRADPPQRRTRHHRA